METGQAVMDERHEALGFGIVENAAFEHQFAAVGKRVGDLDRFGLDQAVELVAQRLPNLEPQPHRNFGALDRLDDRAPLRQCFDKARREDRAVDLLRHLDIAREGKRRNRRPRRVEVAPMLPGPELLRHRTTSGEVERAPAGQQQHCDGRAGKLQGPFAAEKFEGLLRQGR
jgi:hypothetical protein